MFDRRLAAMVGRADSSSTDYSALVVVTNSLYIRAEDVVSFLSVLTILFYHRLCVQPPFDPF